MFYTNFYQKGNETLVRTIDENGKRESKRFTVKPEFFLDDVANSNSQWKNVYGKPVKKIANINNAYDAYAYLRKHRETKPDTPIYGMDNIATQAMLSLFPNMIDYDQSLMRILGIDIEVFSGIGGEFPDPKDALYPITMIACRLFNGVNYLFTLTDYEHEIKETDLSKVNVFHFKCEEQLLYHFVNFIHRVQPDVLVTFNGEQFDLPYIINRLIRLETTTDYITLPMLCDQYPVLDQPSPLKEKDFYLKLSPWGIVKSFTKRDKFQNEYTAYKIIGISHIDYMQVYKKFNRDKLIEYSLGYICYNDLGVSKIEHSYESINHFFVKDPHNFTRYNIRDSDLLYELDKVKGFIGLILNLAFRTKCNFEDTLGTIRMWDSKLYHDLNAQKIVVPVSKEMNKIPYPGAYVRYPVKGKHKRCIAIDLKSLYPHIIMQFNIGMETQVFFDDLPDEIKTNVELMNVTKIVHPLIIQDTRFKKHSNIWNDDFYDDVGDDDETGRPTVEGIDKILNGNIDFSILKPHGLVFAGNNKFFKFDKKSIYSESLEQIYNERATVQKEMKALKVEFNQLKDQLSGREKEQWQSRIQRLDNSQLALKIFMNSLYGATGTPYFRWYDNDVASAITCSAQIVTRWIESKINKFLNRCSNTLDESYVIYADTDSVSGDSLIYINQQAIRIDDFFNTVDMGYLVQDENNEIKFTDHITTAMTSKGELVEGKVSNVKRHQVKKALYRITVNNQSVVVTEDHSIIVKRNDQLLSVKPLDILPTDLGISLVH